MKEEPQVGHGSLSRRDFVKRCAISASALVAMPVLAKTGGNGPASLTLPLDQDWLFGGKLDPAALSPEFDDTAFRKVTLPHCPTKLSWQNWDFKEWQEVWCYR